MSQLNAMTNQGLLDLLYKQFKKMQDKNQLKTFTSDMRSRLGVEWYSEHACRARFNGKGLMQVIKMTFNHSTPYSILNFSTREKVIDYLTAVGMTSSNETQSQTNTAPPPPPPPQTQTKSTEASHDHDNAQDAEPDDVDYDNAGKKVEAGFTFNIDLAGLATTAVKKYVKESGLLNDVQERIKAEAAKLAPTVVHLHEVPKPAMTERTHFMFKQLLRDLHLEQQAFIYGPAGTGKSTLAKQVAKAMNIKFGAISCTAGMAEGHLKGRMVIDGTYIGASFVDVYENGGVFLLDEVDAADNNTLLTINSALANGFMSVENRRDNPIAVRHKDALIVCAANTAGMGATAAYAGRNRLDGAFLDRFVGSTIYVGYDTELEAEILKEYPTTLNALMRVRDNVEKSRIQKIVSTRMYISAAKQVGYAIKYDNLTEKAAAKAYLAKVMTPWSNEEKAKAMEGVLA